MYGWMTTAERYQYKGATTASSTPESFQPAHKGHPLGQVSLFGRSATNLINWSFFT